MNIINEIYRVIYMSDKFTYVGTLRNEKRFKINDRVFFSINGHDIACGRIVGIQLPPEDNPEYIYKIQLPDEVIRERLAALTDEELTPVDKYNKRTDPDKFYNDKDLGKVDVTCRYIFKSIEEAKNSAIENLEKMAMLQRKKIESYFSHFEK